MSIFTYFLYQKGKKLDIKIFRYLLISIVSIPQNIHKQFSAMQVPAAANNL